MLDSPPSLSIYKKLSRLPFWSRPRRGGNQAEDLRGQRTLALLISVVIVFMCSWLPLNLINILNDLGFLDNLLVWIVFNYLIVQRKSLDKKTSEF